MSDKKKQIARRVQDEAGVPYSVAKGAVSAAFGDLLRSGIAPAAAYEKLAATPARDLIARVVS